MIQDIGAGRFHNEYRACTPQPGDRILCYQNRNVLGRYEAGQLTFLTYEEAGGQMEDTFRYLFSIDGVAYFLPEAEAFGTDADAKASGRRRLAAAGAVSDGQTAGSCICSSDGLSAGRMVSDAALLSAVRAQDGTR